MSNKISKVAIITDGHIASTLPLAKHILKKGFEVHFYILYGNCYKTIEGVDPIKRTSFAGTHIIKPKYYENLNEYLDSDNFRFYTVNIPTRFRRIPLVRYAIDFYSKMILKRFYHYINNQNYNMVNLVGRYSCDYFVDIIKNNNKNVVVSLHEVCNHSDQQFDKPSNLISYIIKNNIKVIVHSNSSYNYLNSYEGINMGNVFKINFGYFETFKYLKENTSIILPSKYILFFGNIRPYKGLDVLFNSVNKNRSIFSNLKIVVAGSGDSECLEMMKNDDMFCVFNYFLTNNELAKLISGSEFVVCPYLSMSQSGIPETCFVFNKPVVASDLLGFREIIIDGVNGKLFKVGDSDLLALALNELISNKNMINQMSNNINDFISYNKNLSWDYISDRYIELIN